MSNPLKRYEIILGAIYAALEFLVLPVALSFANLYWDLPLWLLNVIMFCLNFLFMVAILHRFIGNALVAAVKNPFRTLRFAGSGLVLYFLVNIFVSSNIMTLFPDYMNLNNESVADMTLEGGIYVTASAVFLVPVAEELMFRGLIFRGIYEKNPKLAWIVSVFLFSAVHVIGYVGEYQPVMLLVALVQYLPAGIFLNYAYYRSDNIIAPMLMHMAINQIAVSVTMMS